jgi:hypothetical protein
MTESAFIISPPAPAGGFVKEEHLNHRVAFVNATKEVTKSFSGDGDQDAIKCDYVVCIDCPLVVAEPPLIFGGALVPRVTNAGDEIVGGPLVLGKPRPGKHPPYVLEVPADEDLRDFGAFFEKHARRMPSGRIIIEQPGDDEGSE